MVRAGDVISDRYELEAVAGRGGMGEVFRARDRITGAAVAIKILRSENNVRFEREARMLASVRHPGIVRYVDHGENWLAMEWLDGEPLSAAIARRVLTPEETVRLLERVAEALAEAHPLGIVHRDLKPNNIFLVSGDLAQPKLLDFGVARPIGDAIVTATGVLIGTPAYMSPEQARRGRDIDARSDVFSLGCVAFACLTGRSPFQAPDVMTTLMKVMLEEPPSLGIPPALDALIARMLAKSPGGRPRDAAAVLGELRALDLQGAPSEPTVREERITFRVIGRRPIDSEEATLRDEDPTAAIADMGLALDGASFATSTDGLFTASIHPIGSATDRAFRAARLALAIRDALGTIPIIVTAGAVEPHAPYIAVDAPLRSLLSGRFELDGDRLICEREGLERPHEPVTPFVGRDRELAQLESLLDECISESVARVVLITGPTGVGKTRLAHELLEKRARDRALIAVLEISSATAPKAATGGRLVLALARDVPPGWGVEHLRLRGLARRACEQITSDEAILARAEGNPLLLEELVRDPGSVVALAVMQSRLDMLELEARRVLRAASALGRPFTREDLAPLAGELNTWLPILVERELLALRDGRYEFRNLLLRDAAAYRVIRSSTA